MRPSVPCHYLRERYAYGAIEPLTGESCFLIMPYCNTVCGNWLKLLDDIRMLLSELYAEYEKKFQATDYTDIIHEQNTLIKENSGIWEERFADAVA